MSMQKDIKQRPEELAQAIYQNIVKDDMWDCEKIETYLFPQLRQVFNASDVFSPVIFINDQPLLLNFENVACGVHRSNFYLLAFLMQQQNPDMKVEIAMPDDYVFPD